MRIFTKKIACTLMLCVSAFTAMAQDNELTLNVETAGTLPELISAEQKSTLTSLTVTGQINGTDIKYLREMAGRDDYGNEVSGNSLTALDLSAAKIVAGGESYFVPYETTDDVVGEFMFSECHLSSVKIPETTKSIEWSAFTSCTMLQSFTVPDEVEVIDESAFSGCTALTEVHLGSSLKVLDGFAFDECTSLRSVNLPEGLTELNIFAFNGCSSLSEITVPSSVSRIGRFAFSGCSSLSSVEIKSGVQTISDNAFSSCTSLTAIALPSTITTLGVSVFDGCSALTSVSLPEGLTEISESMFSNCTALEYITIPQSVTTIAEMAFGYDEGLKEINIPDAVTYIGDNAFFDNVSLRKVTFGKSLAELGEDVFKFCEKLEAFEVSSENEVFSDVDGVLFNKDATTLLFMPCAYGEEYTVPETCLEIGTGAFMTNMLLKSVVMPDGLKTIGSDAFSFCEYLEKVTIGSGVESIGDDAFFSDDNLKEIHCRISTPLEIGDYTFYGPDKDVCVLYVPENSVDSYKAAEVWSEFKNIMAEPTSGINAVSNNGRNIFINGAAVTLSDTDNNDVVKVYNLSGTVVYEGNGNDVNLPAHNIYIVKAGDKAQKVVLP